MEHMDPNIRCSKRMLNVITHSLTLVSALSKSRELHLTSIQVPMFMSHLHQGHISPRFTPVAMVPFHTLSPHPCRKICISIQVPFHPNPGILIPFSPHLCCVTPPSTLTQFTSHPIKVPRLTSLLHPCHISPPSRSIKLQLTSIQVTRIASLLHPG